MRYAIDDLEKQNLRYAAKEDMMRFAIKCNYAPGKLRLIPKGDTFRPIMTFNRQVPSKTKR